MRGIEDFAGKVRNAPSRKFGKCQIRAGLLRFYRHHWTDKLKLGIAFAVDDCVAKRGLQTLKALTPVLHPLTRCTGEWIQSTFQRLNVR
ncbi:hypothetical protein T05_264 [Trichinella murrelli]|uniref:Uncharacterized protein n=1 Tax=Trichinella murrelli TaxID=144512 RepID=A0A0V0TMV3_9BILA|nr:hypothetical protein T05_264 [Trichinella murrelli]